MLLAQLTIAPGPEAMAALVEQVLSSRRLVVVTPCGEQVLAGLISCLPLDRRPGVSFSTGLKLSPRRPFRISAATADGGELRRQARSLGAEVVVLDQIGLRRPARIPGAKRFAVRCGIVASASCRLKSCAAARRCPSRRRLLVCQAKAKWPKSAGRIQPAGPLRRPPGVRRLMSRLPLCRTGTPRQRRRCAPRASPQCRAPALHAPSGVRRPRLPARFARSGRAAGRPGIRRDCRQFGGPEPPHAALAAGGLDAGAGSVGGSPRTVSAASGRCLEQHGAAADKTAEQSVAALDVLCLLFPEADFPPDRGANHAPE